MITRVGTDIAVPVDEFDGKVIYGEKRRSSSEQFLLQFALCRYPLIYLSRELEATFRIIHVVTFFFAVVLAEVYRGHVDMLAPAVADLARLEESAQVPNSARVADLWSWRATN